jgi:septum formation protein
LAPRTALILASSSPRRLELLRQIDIDPNRIEPPDVDETPGPRELPRAYAARLARDKALAVAARVGREAGFVLAADTVVACGRRVLPKAETAAEATACLDLLSGRRHRVHGGVCVLAPDGRESVRVVTTAVHVKRLTSVERERYLASGEWHGKAGGYAIQGSAEGLIAWIGGSHSGVVGLPLFETRALLRSAGFAVG